MDETFVGAKSAISQVEEKEFRQQEPWRCGQSDCGWDAGAQGPRQSRSGMERTKLTLHALANKHISPGATLVTDEWHAYKGSQFQHEIINHACEYVRGQSTLRASRILGTAQAFAGHLYAVEPFHLDAMWTTSIPL